MYLCGTTCGHCSLPGLLCLPHAIHSQGSHAPRACKRFSVSRAVAKPTNAATQAPAASELTVQQGGSRKEDSRRSKQASNGRAAVASPWEGAYHGYLHNLNPVCKNDRQNLQELRAAMRIALKTGGKKPEAVSTCLRKLSLMGCYDPPLYSMLMAMLARALVLWPWLCSPRHISLALFSCALSRAFDVHVDGVAAWVGRHQEQHLQRWKAQHLSNALFAWAVMSATACGNTPAMRACAQSLFAAANSRGSAGFAVRNDLGKLHWAHLEAQHVGLPGGGLLDVGLQQAAQAEAARVQRQVSEELGGVMREVAVVLEGLGYGVVAMLKGGQVGSGHDEGLRLRGEGSREQDGTDEMMFDRGHVGSGHGGGLREEVSREQNGTTSCGRDCAADESPQGDSRSSSRWGGGGRGGNSSSLLATPLLAPAASLATASDAEATSADATERRRNQVHTCAHSHDVRPRPIVVAFTRQQDCARYPADWLRGKAALRLAHAARVPGVAGVAVVQLEEWAVVRGDCRAQRAYLASRMQRQALLGEGCAVLGEGEGQ